VFWSRTDRIERPLRSAMLANTTLATGSTPQVTLSSRRSDPARYGRRLTCKVPDMSLCLPHTSSHSSSTFTETSVRTKCWNWVVPLPMALVVAVRPELAISAPSSRGPPTRVCGVR